MKHWLLLSVFALGSASLFANPFSFPERGAGYFGAELQAIQAEQGSRTLSDVTVGELIPAAQRLDVARQKDGYVMILGGMSMVWPGAGQFASGAWAGGALHTGLHLGISLASLAWAHSLLPADLQWGTLDYMHTSESAIQSAWTSHPVADFLPGIGALALGGVLDLTLRVWSAQDARSTAKAQIDAGKVTFEPRFDHGHWGLRVRF